MSAADTSSRIEDRIDLRFQSFEDHILASLDRFGRDILHRLEDQASTFTFMAVLAIVGTSLSVGLVLIASLL
jgi:hypothetical protein